MSVKNAALKTALLSPNLPNGPISLKHPLNKRKYQSPIGMDEIYPLAYEVLEKDSEKLYNKIDELKLEISKTTGTKEKRSLERKIENLMVQAEKYNPTVMFNARYYANSLDLTQPVYRRYLREKWESYGKMLIMQRLETMNVIPDTLPTLEPTVDVKMKFPHNNIEKWIEPGEILSSNVTSKPPLFEITEYKEVKEGLYSILIVNPDVPDLETNSFSTTLQWGVQDIKLSNTDREFTPLQLEENPDLEFVEYLPATPEKNAPTNRMAVWVFKQTKELKIPKGELNREKFNIREFVEKYELRPVGAHLFRSIWDRNVNNVREMYGLPLGRIFHRVRR